MERKTILIITFISIPLLATTLFFLILNLNLGPKLECNTISYSGENAFNLVFFSNENTAKRYSEALFDYSPFKENRNAFNIYQINENPECEIYRGVALFCHSRSLIKKASSCPNDYILVLTSAERKIRSSAYLNVLSINSNHELSVIAHEFGHAFANLAEEYTPAEVPEGVPNCFASCSEFTAGGCYQGCSSSSYFRSIDEGVMRTLGSREFGKHNENVILERIKTKKNSGGFIGLSPEECTDEFYIIKGDISQEGLELKEKSLEKGCSGENGYGRYSYKVKDNSNTEIKEDKFSPENVFTDLAESKELSGETFSYEGEFYIKVPKISKDQKLEIYLESKKILDQLISELPSSEVCKDTDFENILETRGTVLYQNTEYEDSCEEQGLSVRQYFCDGDKIRDYVKRCPAGLSCFNGACI